LKDDAEVFPAPACHAVLVEFMNGGTIHKDFARGRMIDAGDHVEQGAFAAA